MTASIFCTITKIKQALLHQAEKYSVSSFERFKFTYKENESNMPSKTKKLQNSRNPVKIQMKILHQLKQSAMRSQTEIERMKIQKKRI